MCHSKVAQPCKRTFFFPKAPETKFVVNQNHRKPYFLRAYAKKKSPPLQFKCWLPLRAKVMFRRRGFGLFDLFSFR